MSGPNRTILAFLVAPLVAASALGVLTLMSGNTDIVMILGLVLICYFYCAAPLFIMGTPIYLLLKFIGWLNFWSILATGIGIGALATLGLRFPSVPEQRDLLVFASVGALASFVFWIIWRSGDGKG